MQSHPRWARLAAACGVLYPIALVVGDDLIAKGDEAAPDAGTPDEVLAALVDKDVPSFFLGRSLGTAAWMLLLVFVVFLAVRVRRARGDGDLIAPLLLSSGAVVTALALASAVFQIRTVRRAGDGLDAVTAVTFLDMSYGFGLAMLPMAVLFGAIAAGSIRGDVLAGWLGWAAGALAVGHAIGFVLTMLDNAASFVVMIATWLWFIAAGINTWHRTSNRQVETPKLQTTT